MSIRSVTPAFLKAFIACWAFSPIIVDAVMIHKAKRAVQSVQDDINLAHNILGGKTGTANVMRELADTEHYLYSLRHLFNSGVIVLVAAIVLFLVLTASLVPSLKSVGGCASVITSCILFLQILVPIIVLSVSQIQIVSAHCRNDGYCSIAGATVALGWVLTVLAFANVVTLYLLRGDIPNKGIFNPASSWFSFLPGRIAIPDHEEQIKPLLPEDFELPKSPSVAEVIFEEKSASEPVGVHEGQATLIYPG